MTQSKDYVSIVYDEKKRPRTDYPSRLASHLFDRYRMAKGMKILDTGCGRGELLEGFDRLGLEVTGLDRSPSAIEQLQRFHVGYCDLGRDAFPFPDAAFDVVFSKSMIEHFYEPDHFLSESLRVLKPGGRLIVLTPDWVTQMPIFYDDHTHRRPYTVSALDDLLRLVGLQNVTSQLFYQLPIVWRYPPLKCLSRLLQPFVPVTWKSKIKFLRWSVELMILATGVKP